MGSEMCIRDRFLNSGVREASHQLADPEIFRADAINRRDRPTKDVVLAAEFAGLLDRHHIFTLFNDADRRAIAARVAADSAELFFRDVAALGTELHLLFNSAQHFNEARDIDAFGLDDVEGDTLRRLWTDAGQSTEFIDEILNEELALPTMAGKVGVGHVLRLINSRSCGGPQRHGRG